MSSLVKVQRKGQLTIPSRLRTTAWELAKGLEDIQKGRVYGPFNTAEEMAASIEANIRKTRRASKIRKPAR